MIKSSSPLTVSDDKDMNFAVRLSFLIGIFMLLIKSYAYYITNSTAILSDAAESIIHILAVGFAAYSMWLSLKPPDEDHHYGHDKISFFSAGFEGAMIIVAALFITYESLHKIIFGFTISHLNEGIIFIFISIAINLILAYYLLEKGKKYHSIILEANGKHILTDCWTSTGVVGGLILVQWTGIILFDPLIAIGAAVNILWTGSKLVKTSISGLMDRADPRLNQQIIEIITKETEFHHLEFHNFRHRLSGQKILIEFHLLFSQTITLQEAHILACEIEANIKRQLEKPTDILTHLEPKENHDELHQKYGLLI